MTAEVYEIPYNKRILITTKEADFTKRIRKITLTKKLVATISASEAEFLENQLVTHTHTNFGEVNYYPNKEGKELLIHTICNFVCIIPLCLFKSFLRTLLYL